MGTSSSQLSDTTHRIGFRTWSKLHGNHSANSKHENAHKNLIRLKGGARHRDHEADPGVEIGHRFEDNDGALMKMGWIRKTE